MNPHFQKLMHDATQWTRAGDLKASMSAIQLALKQVTPTHADGGDIAAVADIIDIEARVIAEPGRPTNASPKKSEPDEFSSGSFKNHAGALNYKLFVPRLIPGRPIGLIVMLHGCTQNPDDFAAGTRMNELAATHNMLVLYPAQAQHANAQGCWNWFKHSHQGKNRGEPAILAGMTQDVIARHGVDAGRVFVAGLSAGGAMAAILGTTHPELFAAVGIHSGLPAGAASDLPSALAAMKGKPAPAAKAAARRPTIVFHGSADTTVHPSNGLAAAHAAAANDTFEEQHSSSNERRCTRRLYKDVNGHTDAEYWSVQGLGHAWSGGSSAGSYTDTAGPDASREMLRFFGAHARQT